jgi:hypothetical protein
VARSRIKTYFTNPALGAATGGGEDEGVVLPLLTILFVG